MTTTDTYCRTYRNLTLAVLNQYTVKLLLSKKKIFNINS